MHLLKTTWIIKNSKDFIKSNLSVNLRSTVGMIFKQQSCVFPNSNCHECSLAGYCYYSKYFETYAVSGDANDVRRIHAYRICIFGGRITLVTFGKESRELSNIYKKLIEEALVLGLGPKNARIKLEAYCSGTQEIE